MHMGLNVLFQRMEWKLSVLIKIQMIKCNFWLNFKAVGYWGVCGASEEMKDLVTSEFYNLWLVWLRQTRRVEKKNTVIQVNKCSL